MVSPVLYEHFYDGAFLVREAAGNRSRDGGVMSNSGGSDLLLDAGLVVTQADYGTPTAAAKTGGNTGNGTVGSMSAGLGAQVGAYTVVFTAATVFSVFDPSGKELKNGATGTAYSDEINFTITAGGTAFVAGDGFTITVPAGTGAWAPYTSSTPAQNLAILYNRVAIPASGSKKVTLISRECEVNKAELVWDPSIAAAGGIASAAGGSNVGNGTIGSLSIVSAAQVGNVYPPVPTGVYTITAESALEFVVEDPTGEVLGTVGVGQAFANEIGFTITAGGTAFAEGDYFTVTVTESGQVQALAALAAAGIIAR
jgi:hypothetical protein